MSNTNAQPKLLFILKIFGVTVLYTLLAYVQNYLFDSRVVASIAEPLYGFSMAVLLIGGRKYIWGVLLGSLLAGAMSEVSLMAAAIVALGKTLEALVAAWIFTRFCRSAQILQSLDNYILLIAAGSIGGIICALTETIIEPVIGNFFLALFHNWMGEILGIVLFTPLILTWWQRKNTHHKQMAWILKSIPLLFLALLAGQIIFLELFHSAGNIFEMVAKGYWMFLFISLIAVRLGTYGTMIALNITAIQALLGAYHGLGFFANDIAKTHLSNYWFYMVTLSMVGMSLATYFAELKKSEAALRLSAQRFRDVSDAAGEYLWEVDAKLVYTYVSNRSLEVKGYSSEELLGHTPMEFMPEEDIALMEEVVNHSIINKTPFRLQHRDITRSGAVQWEEVNGLPIYDEKGTVIGLRGAGMNITDRKNTEEQIRELAFIDPLTKLPNRRLLHDRLHQALALSIRSEQQGALLFIDLDHFKVINDTKGHDIGDLLLVEVANRLRSIIREGDTAARLGGDEFVVMIEGMDNDEQNAASQAEMVGEKILASLGKIYFIDDKELHCTASIGITLFRGETKTWEEMLRRADVALYQAKSDGRNSVRFFDPVLQSKITARISLESDLRHAVSEMKQFHLYYQPQIDSTGNIIGAEALLRWNHPERGMVPPTQFIPLAEESGMIMPLGNWVVATACQQLDEWAKHPETAHLILAVNVSAKQFNSPTFIEEVFALIDYMKVDRTKLKLEITESMMMKNVDEIIEKMNKLKAHGISFSMDDFGTGFSSLSYLKRLPLCQLKIDQSFVRDVLTDPNDAAIARTIVALAQSMNLTVIAEGVESEEQRLFFDMNGCHNYQGYLFSQPVPIKQFDALLEDAKPV